MERTLIMNEFEVKMCGNNTRKKGQARQKNNREKIKRNKRK